MIPNLDVMLINRELSLLKFNERVLAMAEKSSVPLLERLRYLCIVSSNLDEFFEIRISSLKEQIDQAPHQVRADGYTPLEVFAKVQRVTHDLVDKQNHLLLQHVLPALMQEGIGILRPPQWSEQQKNWAKNIFVREILPLLTPKGLDPAHPFPRVYNKSLNFITSIAGDDAFGRTGSIALVQAPRALPRLLKMPEEIAEISHGYVLLSALISTFIDDLFPGMHVEGCFQWRVTRNSDLYIDEEETTNLRKALQGELSQRNFGAAVRIEVDVSMPDIMIHFLQRAFSLADADTYRVLGPVNLSRLSRLCDVATRPDLIFPVYHPPIPAPFNQLDDVSAIFKVIARKDQLLHHPYQSFQPVLSFLRAAVMDPQVVAIKQTIYRTGEDSELMGLLMQAAKAGKEVSVVVELMARFDEQTNINWAARLEEVGAHVNYGVVGFKIHAKMVLVLRREQGGIRRYVHLGTGNYHPRTARLYTDIGLLTANTEIGLDVEQIFSQLTGLGSRRNLQQLLQAPFSLHQSMMAFIQREIDEVKQGRKGHIMAKMNSLLEPQIIQQLYAASQAGVRIDLIVRGACALRAGVPGLSENIQVRSIIGRFLEHSRVYYFYNQGLESLYISSADWMDRNFFRRVELAVPIFDKDLKNRIIKEALHYALLDNQLAWQAQPNGDYVRIRARNRKVFNLHDQLMQELGQ